MTRRFGRQRGAVTLIGALFVLITLALMIQVLHRMAGSDILDTAVQNDSVEALFIAETGVEHASFLYAGGTACSGLSGVNATTGRGSFTITNAFIVGTDCRIRVQGTTGSGAVAQAVRTVDADLRLAAGDGWIVGDNGTILRWEGAAWNAVASGTTRTLNGVYCVSATDCWAVGNNSTILHWDGSDWTVLTTGRVALQGVSCAPNNPNFCVAVGTGSFFGFPIGVVARWDGSTWSVVNSGLSTLFRRYLDVSCPDTLCYLVSSNGRIDRYNGTSIINDGSRATVSMNGIDCTSATDCWAVGNRTGNNWNLDFRNGGGWTPLTVGVNNQANQHLNAVSCANAGDCWAVGNRDGNRYVLGHWNGSAWSQFTLGNGAQRDHLNAVHCLSVNDCWAAGDYRNGGNVLHFDGSTWSYVGAAVTTNTDLNGVHFPPGAGSSGSNSAVTLVRWQEIIN
ncbi:MAG TPA: hypothetical protein ENK49_00645 [Gammaproteobacteria bacterium]|nr:hypothetical protein [Gammaproteobacteria bacterium]